MSDQSPTMAPRYLRVFLSYASEDESAVRALHQRLKSCQVDSWLDKEGIFGGQNWQYEIRKAVRKADVVIVCLSQRSISKTGFVQRELKFVLDVADEQPEGTIFIIPLRLEKCKLPDSLQERHLQWIDYIKEDGFDKLIRSLQQKAETAGETILPVDCQASIPAHSIHVQHSAGQPNRSASSPLLTNVAVNHQLAASSTSYSTISSPPYRIKRRTLILGIVIIFALIALIPLTLIFFNPFKASPKITPSTSSSTPFGGTPVLDDPLRDHSKGYGWDETEGHCTFRGGAYHVTTSNPNNYECNTNSQRADFSNFAYQVTMKIDQGTKGGICFRFTVNDQTGYCFFLDLNGQYILEKVNFNTPREEVLVSGRSMYFLTGLGKTNQIAVRAQGSTIDLYINGHFIRSATDSSFSHGQIGVFLVYPGFFTEAEFTDAKVWVY